jgi:ubiquinone/menaquinone biosynthesis C-methylase UbiE
MVANWLALLVTVPVVAAAQQSGISAERILKAAGVQEGSTVCEVGAGEGELSVSAARRVGPSGRVYASELGEARVKKLQGKIGESGLANIRVVAGDALGTNFPDGACDAVLIQDVYHHLTDPAAMNRSVAAAVKAGGRVAIIDFTPPGREAERPADRAKDGMHGVSPETVAREMKEAGFEPVLSEAGKRWFLVVFAAKERGERNRLTFTYNASQLSRNSG